jgi:hypothetical protein
MATDAGSIVAVLAAGRHGAFSRMKAASSGLGPHLVQRLIVQGFLAEPVPGVLIATATQDTWHRRMGIATSAGREAGRASHRAAARLFRLDGQLRASVEVLVARPRRLVLPAEFDAIVHQATPLDRRDMVVVDKIPCTSLARTLADLGSVVGDDAVWKALIAARRIHRVSPPWLMQTALRLHRPGQAGTGRLLRALRRWASEGQLPDSWLEELIHRMLVDPGMPPLERQHPIVDHQGRTIARADIGIPAARVALEGHSRQFHFGPIREAADEDRDLAITRAGYEVIYLGWFAAKSPAEVLPAIRDIVEQRLRLLGRAA